MTFSKYKKKNNCCEVILIIEQFCRRQIPGYTAVSYYY